MDYQTVFGSALAGIILWDLANFLYRKIRSNTIESSWNKERDKALKVTSEHKINAYYYLPCVGHRDDAELCEALDSLAGKGFIMTNSKGDLVGKVAKTSFNATNVADTQRARFSVVQDN